MANIAIKTSLPAKLAKAAKHFKLTGREKETLTLLATGEPWKSAALVMGISLSTVKFHARNFCKKTKAPNAIGALNQLLKFPSSAGAPKA